MSSACGWSRAYGSGGSAECAQLWNCIGDRRVNANGGTGYILDFFSETVTTCAEAMGIIGDELKKRLCASWVTTSGQANTYTITLKLGAPKLQTATVTLVPSSSCKFPIQASYEKGAKSGSSYFQSIPDLMNYLVFALKR